MAKIGVLPLAGVILLAAAGGGAPAGRAGKAWDPMCPCWVDGSPAGDRSPAGEGGDLWAEALALLGRTEADLGYRPKGYWARYPLPSERGIPYILPAFNDLLAEPLRVADYTRLLGEGAAKWMVENRADHGLVRTFYYLATDRLVSGFRSYWNRDYCPFCENIADPERPLQDALGRLFALPLESGLQGEEESLDLATRQVLGDLLLDLAVAHEWVERSFRNVSPEVRAAVAAVHDLEETQTDGQKYYPEFDDLMADWDVHSFLTGAQIAINAADRAGLALLAIPEEERRWEGVSLAWETPMGTVEVARQCKPWNDPTVRDFGQTWAGLPGLLQIDLVGCDSMWLRAALGTPEQPVSVALDLGGDDVWGGGAGHENAGGPPASPGFGAGLAGVGVLWDGAGDDTYTLDERGQGYGQAGVGLLYDREGDDRYSAHHNAQGAAWFGAGMLVDEAGNDTYTSITTSQGSGNVYGVGSIVDVAGNDSYYVEPWSEVAGLAGDYHSGDHILGNNAQGAGFGRRGDLTDGHSWAGGLGALVDLAGDDRYFGGNWIQGVGYWYGMGIMYDADGNDTYSSVYFATASGAHYAIGAILDLGGDDSYLMWGDSTKPGLVGGAGLSFGWDYVVTILLNVGGDDEYQAELISLGCANIRSVSIFADIGGDDTYRFPDGQCGLGDTDRRAQDADPLLYYIYSETEGIFVDLGGRDTYLDFYDIPGRRFRPSARWGDGLVWFHRPLDEEARRLRVYGVGLDRATGSFWGFTP